MDVMTSYRLSRRQPRRRRNITYSFVFGDVTLTKTPKSTAYKPNIVDIYQYTALTLNISKMATDTTIVTMEGE